MSNTEKKTAMQKVNDELKGSKAAQIEKSNSAVNNLIRILDKPAAQKELSKACAKHMTPEKLIRFARTAAQRQPELWECTPISFFGAVIDCAQMGLEPLPALGHVYLVPYNNRKNNTKEVQVQLGYKGMIAMALRSGKFSYITGDVICENDQVLEYQEGIEPKFILKPAFPKPRGEVLGAYAIAFLKDNKGPPLFKIADKETIEEARERSVEYRYWKNKGSNMKGKKPIWVEHFKPMAIKTAIRRLSPFLAMTPEMQSFFEIDAKREVGIDTPFSEIKGILSTDKLIEVEHDNTENLNQSED